MLEGASILAGGVQVVGKERDSRKYRIRGKIRLRVFTDVNCRLGVVACISADVTDGVPKATSGPKKNIAKKQLDGISACSARLRHFGCSLRRHANHPLKPSRNNPYPPPLALRPSLF